MPGYTPLPVVTRLPRDVEVTLSVIQPAEPLALHGEGETTAAPTEGSKPSAAGAGQPISQAPSQSPAPLPPVEVKTEDEATPLPNYLVSPNSGMAADSVHMITVVMRSSGDKTRDVLRVRRIYGLVMSYPGNDRFAFHVFERGQGYLVEFPNFTTGYCSELVVKLQQLVGAENLRIDKITFQ
jgi:hypothetical protein